MSSDNARVLAVRIIHIFKAKLAELRSKVIENVAGNIRDQCNEDSYFYSWSGLDLEATLTIDDRIMRLKELFDALCYPREHTMMEFRNETKKTVTETKFEGYKV